MVSKILVAGDWHGNTNWATKMVRTAARLDIKKIVQLGDFGLWDHREDGFRYLDTLNSECREAGVRVYFVDGNHENHDRLEWYDANNPQNEVGHVMVRSHIYHLPRGSWWLWEGISYAAVGGAVSIDKAYRTPGSSWWAGEQLTDAEVDRFESDKNRAKYLFTHDCPTNAPFRHRIKEDFESQIHRQRMNRVGKIVQPSVWFHGHMHEKYEYDFRHDRGLARVFGLEMDTDFFSWGILDPGSGRFTWGPQYTN